MATSLNRKNRRRRRKAAGLVAVGASAALMGGLLAPPAPADAALLPLSLGSIGAVLPVGVASCDAGDSEVQKDLLNLAAADCTQASPWLLTSIADALLGVVAPDIAGLISIGGLNGALATAGPEGDVSLWPPSLSAYIPGSATISGSGYTTAITMLGGESTARADYILAAAVAVAATGGIASADSLFGVSIASAIGRPATQAGIGPWALGSPRVENSAKAKSLPAGIAIANSSLTVGELFSGLLQNVPQHRTSAVALGGVAAAYRSFDGSQGAVCTALYGEARVRKETLNNAGDVTSSQRTNSCTSVLFIFQKQQNVDQHDGFVVYAIKNPLDIGLVSPFGDNIADLFSEIGGSLFDLGPLNDVLAGKFVPEFQSDIVRIVMTDDGPKLDSDLPEWIGGLFGGLFGATGAAGNALFSGASSGANAGTAAFQSLDFDDDASEPSTLALDALSLDGGNAAKPTTSIGELGAADTASSATKQATPEFDAEVPVERAAQQENKLQLEMVNPDPVLPAPVINGPATLSTDNSAEPAADTGSGIGE